MLISHGFDEANAVRRKRIETTAMSTAEKLNRRMLLFLDDVQKNASLSNDAKRKIREKLIEHI